MLAIPRLVDRAERAAARWGLRGAQWYTRRSRGALPAASASSSSHCNRVPSSLLAAAAPRGALETLSRPLQGSWEASFGRRLARLAFSSGNRPSMFLRGCESLALEVQEDATSSSAPQSTLSYLKKRFRATAGGARRKLLPQARQSNRKFDYQGTPPLKHTSDQSTSLPLSFPLVAFANKSSRDDPSWGSEA